MAQLTYSPSAQKDIKDLAAYIARDKPSAARKWVQKLRNKCQLIAKNPELGVIRSELGVGVRSTYLGDYIIFFRTDAQPAEILRIMRGNRDIKSL
jgi:toxin ParE1/3/4